MPAVTRLTVAGMGTKIGSPNTVNVEPIWFSYKSNSGICII